MIWKLAAAATAAPIFAGAASAEIIDPATVKRWETATMNEQGGTFMFTWLMSYLNG